MVISRENDESEQGVSAEWFRVVRIEDPMTSIRIANLAQNICYSCTTNFEPLSSKISGNAGIFSLDGTPNMHF